MLDDLADRGVRPPTVKYTLDILRITLRAAQRADLIQRENPASIVRAPTFRRRKAQPFTALEAQAFLGAVREDRLHALWALGLTAALRRGELLGLQWGDVQLERRRILIARQLQRQKGKGLVAKVVKRERSEAPVVLTALAVRAVEAHRARLSEERLAAGPEWRGSDDPLAPDAYVFVTELGSALDPDATYRRFAALLKEAGLPAHRMHDMRHTTATLLHALNVPAAVARDVLRHTDIKTTLGIYTASDERQQLQAADGLDELLGGALG
jgi:integrase